MIQPILITAGKLISTLSKVLGRGNGSTWPGHIALSTNPTFIHQILKKNPHLKIILVIGTNGKTTTSKMIATILKNTNKTVIQNTSGANLLNGIASTLLLHASITGKIKAGYAIFEVDENAVPGVLAQITPFAIVVLNLFRDQLDRYGELDSIVKKWNDAFVSLPTTTHLILNADDPLIAYGGHNTKTTTVYYGLAEKDMHQKALAHGADSIYCPRCSTKLTYKHISYAHLGVWKCPNCKLQRPDPTYTFTNVPLPLTGTYNKYNAYAAMSLARAIGLRQDVITTSLKTMPPAFGRQETLSLDGKQVQLFLAKNPTSFNQSLETITTQKAKHVLFVLNDRIPDGRDVSWIWDIALEEYLYAFQSVTLSGDRVYDMAVRIHYAQTAKQPTPKITVEPDLTKAISQALTDTPQDETLFILPTYSAMLDVRKILTGKKIL